MMPEDIVGCVLAGGQSTRMGQDKALLTLGGVPMIGRAVALLRSVFREVIVASDRREAYAFLDVPIVPDIVKQCGPLGGIHAALKFTHADAVFVLACDMPFVPAELVRSITHAGTNSTAAVPVMEGRVHPLCGVYPRSTLPAIEQALKTGRYALVNVLEELQATLIPLTPELPFYAPHILDNLNRAEDLERALFIAN